MASLSGNKGKTIAKRLSSTKTPQPAGNLSPHQYH
jgi:hypothetical protein